MIDLKLNEEHDLSFINNDIEEVSEIEEVIQNVALLVRTRMGEFFADKELGLDYEYVIADNYNKEYATAAIIEAVESDTRVVNVTSIDITKLANRELNVQLSFTIDDDINANTEVKIIA